MTHERLQAAADAATAQAIQLVAELRVQGRRCSVRLGHHRAFSRAGIPEDHIQLGIWGRRRRKPRPRQ